MTTATAPSSGRGSQVVNATTDAYTPQEIQTVLLSDGYHSISDAQLIQFAIGEARSPITAPKLYPSLRFRDISAGGIWVTVPLSQIVAVSKDQVSSETLGMSNVRTSNYKP